MGHEDQQSGGSARTQSASARAFVGAAVNYIATGSDGLRRAQRYAAIVTAINDTATSISLAILAPSALLNLGEIQFSAKGDPGCWTWPAAGGS